MNKIYKVIWSKVKNCYIVVSELAKRVSRSSTASRAGRASLAAVMAAAALTVGTIDANTAWAADDSITETNAAFYAAIGDASVGDNPFITNSGWGTDNGSKLDGVVSTSKSNGGRTVTVKLGDGREYTYNYTTVRDANGNSYNYWIRDGFGVKAITERYHSDALNIKLDLFIKGQANYDDIVTTGEHSAAITDVTTAINNTTLDEMAYIQYAAITNSASTEVAEGFHYYIKQGEQYKDVGNNTVGAGLTNNFYVFKSSEFNDETGKYQFNGQDVEYGDIYQIDGSIGVFLDKQVTGANRYSSTELARNYGANVYGGTVYGLNNEVLVTGYNNKTGQWSTVWAAEVTDPNATIQSMTLDEFNEIMHHLHLEDVKLANADIVTTKVTNGKTNGISSSDNTTIPNGGSINLINKAGNQVPGLTVTYGGGTGGNDTFIMISDTGTYVDANGNTVAADAITLNTGSVVTAGVKDGTANTLSSLTINGQNYILDTGTASTPTPSGYYKPTVDADGNLTWEWVDGTGSGTIDSGNIKGADGAKGDKGDKGDTGEQGPVGPQGPQGEKGDTGATGAQGPQGEKGDKGDTGATGPQGPQGATGPQGDKGADGASIADGTYAVSGNQVSMPIEYKDGTSAGDVTITGIASTGDINNINTQITNLNQKIDFTHGQLSGEIIDGGKINRDDGTISVHTNQNHKFTFEGKLTDERLTGAEYDGTNGTLTLTTTDRYTPTSTHEVTVSGIASKGDINKLQGDITNIQGDVTNLQGDVTNIRGDVNNLHNDVTNIQGDVTNIRGDVNNLHTDVTNIQGDITNLRGDVNNLHTDVTNIQGDVTNLQGDVTNIKGDITNIQGDVNNIQGDITNLDNRVTANETNISNIQGDVTTIRGDITNIQGDVTNIRGDITNIQGDVTNIRGDITNIQGDITNLDTRVTTVEKDMIVGGDINETDGTVTLTKGDGQPIKIGNICDSRLDNVTYDADKGKLTFTVTDHYDQDNQTTLEVDDIASKTALEKEVTDRQTMDREIIKDYTQRTDALSGQINSLGHRMTKGIAGAAALAALHPLDFDPDDKLSFSAGVGNYGGSTAAAIGAFYRPNERVMFSVGGTVGNGEDMVNAGVSFALGKGGKVNASRVAMTHEINDLRQQVAYLSAVVAQMAEQTGYQFTDMKAFPDTPENHWAYEYVAKLAAEGIVEGYPSGNFDGDRTMTRYEFAAMLFRALEKGFQLDKRVIDEFEPELGRLSVERIRGEQNQKNKIERVRVNNKEADRDVYGTKINVGKVW